MCCVIFVGGVCILVCVGVVVCVFVFWSGLGLCVVVVWGEVSLVYVVDVKFQCCVFCV